MQARGSPSASRRSSRSTSMAAGLWMCGARVSRRRVLGFSVVTSCAPIGCAARKGWQSRQRCAIKSAPKFFAAFPPGCLCAGRFSMGLWSAVEAPSPAAAAQWLGRISPCWPRALRGLRCVAAWRRCGALRPIKRILPAVNRPSAKQAERRTTAARCLGGQGFWADRKAGGSQRLGYFLARQLRVGCVWKHGLKRSIVCTRWRAVSMVRY